MPLCALRYCKNSTENTSKASEITFHKFLRPDHNQKELWIKFVQNERGEETWLPSEHTHICSAHFREEDFYVTETGRKFLKKSVVPYNPHTEHLDTDDIELPIERKASPCSIDNEYVSDSESIFDSPEEISLRTKLRKASTAKHLLSKQVNNLKRQNRSLKNKNDLLSEVLKEITYKFDVYSKSENDLIDKAEICELYKHTINKLKILEKE